MPRTNNTDAAGDRTDVDSTTAEAVSYDPADVTKWDANEDPGNVNDALDQIAGNIGLGAAHNLLDGTIHPDTDVDDATQGSLIYANPMKQWDELDIGANPQGITASIDLLHSDGTDVGYMNIDDLAADAAPDTAADQIMSWDNSASEHKKIALSVLEGNLDHGNLAGLADDDHAQYHNDARGDARYFTEAEHLNASAGAGDAGKPIKLDAEGHVDATMIDDGDIDHGSLVGLGGDDHWHYFLVDGTRPLTGNLDVGGQSIVSVANGDIPIAPNGTGEVVLDGVPWPLNGTGSGTDWLLYTVAGKGYWANFSELTEPAGGTDPAADWLCIYDVSTTTHRKVQVEDLLALAHTHDGETLQHDAVNSDNVGGFTFTTAGTVTFTQAIQIALDKKMMFGDTDVYIFSDDDGDMDIIADNDIVIAGANLTTVGVVGTTTIGDGNLRQFEPDTDLKVNLGRAAKRYNEVWAGGGIRTQYDATDIAGVVPTDAELDAIFGTPAAVGAGFLGVLNDNGGDVTLKTFLCASTGSAWFHVPMTKAV